MSSGPYLLSITTFSIISSASYRMQKGIVLSASPVSVVKPGWGVVVPIPSLTTRMMKKRTILETSALKGEGLPGRGQWQLTTMHKLQRKQPSRKNKKPNDLLNAKRQSQEKY